MDDVETRGGGERWRRRLRDESLDDDDELEELELELEEDEGERRPMVAVQISINASNATSQKAAMRVLLVSYRR